MSELPEKPSKDRTAVELFAGAGGLAMAVRNAGFRPLLVNEFAKHACATLRANQILPRERGDVVPAAGDSRLLVEGDVQRLDMRYLKGAVDVLAGGPPCQPFSLGGVAKGEEDKRNMFPEMFRAVREIEPKAVICENVKGLLRPSFKPYFDYILRELELPFEEREDTNWEVHDKQLRERIRRADVDPHQRYNIVLSSVNAADYGVPQVRNRIIVVAFRADLDVDLDAFRAAVEPTHSEDALIRSILNGEYWEKFEEMPPDHVRERVEGLYKGKEPADDGKLPWRTLRDAIYGKHDERGVLRDPLPPVPWDRLDRMDFDPGFRYHAGWPGARFYHGHTPNYLDRPAKTVKAGVHGVPGGESVMLTDDLDSGRFSSSDGSLDETLKKWPYKHRYMTVRETARVMTFPDQWHLEGPRGEKMRQLGNAVPVLLGEVFAKAVAAVLDEAEKR
ncbi:DNA cytosine methyltransferase [Actinosynnema sp. NPDC020468]|uniref:DNA cytosine methyltransferase n=1 Tax=Actinosynnema sp. NPDC020468 TaxID=3154488 RepID=UPI0033F0371A